MHGAFMGACGCAAQFDIWCLGQLLFFMVAADQMADDSEQRCGRLATADYYGGSRKELRGNGAKWEDSQVGTGLSAASGVRFQIRVPIRVEQEAKETQHAATIIRWHVPSFLGFSSLRLCRALLLWAPSPRTSLRPHTERPPFEWCPGASVRLSQEHGHRRHVHCRRASTRPSGSGTPL